MDPHVQAQDEDSANQDGQALECCFCNPIILQKIFHHISNLELLTFSRVNKQWNYEARSVMKKRGNLKAYLRCAGYLSSCEPELAAFATDLQEMNVVPFSGISIQIGHWRSYRGFMTKAVDLTHDLILDRLSPNNVSINLTEEFYHESYTSCPTILLARKLLRYFSGTLEELSLNIFNASNRAEFVEHFFQGCSLPRLKILKLGELFDLDVSYDEYMKALVACAPNLQELHVEGQLNLQENVMKGSSAVLIFKPLNCEPCRHTPENLFGALRLGVPLIYAGRSCNLDISRFNRIFPALLQAATSTLSGKMYADAVLAVRLMRYGIRLENIREFNMCINYQSVESVQARLTRMLKNFDFTRILPSVETVAVWGNISRCEQFFPEDQVNILIEEAKAVLGIPLPDRAANVKELFLCAAHSNNPTEFYAQMFPNIDKLHISWTEDREIPFASLWEYWVNLKELDVIVKGDLLVNIDSVICGIFPEEVAELRKMGDEFLKRVNIVPIAPSITFLTNLRSFTFKLGYIYRNSRLPLLPSKVTGILAFGKCPQLTVTIKTNWLKACQRMGHLKPYASVVVERR